MKTLLLTCNTGEGHNSAATAIKEVFDAQGDECRIMDCLGFYSKTVSVMFSNFHASLYRNIPKLNRRSYEIVEKQSMSFDSNLLLRKWIEYGAEKLRGIVSDGRFDTVVCVHIIAAAITTELIRKHPSVVNTCFVCTDYCCTYGLKDTSLDICFVPHEDLICEFTKQGIGMESIVPSGIPVKGAFLDSVNTKKQAKALLGLSASQRNILLMCGSMGCGPIERIEELLTRSLPPNVLLTIICGTNKRLLNTLSKKNHNNTRLLGYTSNIPLLMDSADLLLTKPGGLTISEASIKGLPMLLLDVVGGTETRNLSYFTKTGLAQSASAPNEIADLCVEIIQDTEGLQQRSETLKRTFHPHAAQTVYDVLLSISS